MKCPILFVFGENDPYVASHRSAARVESCIAAWRRHDITVRMVPGASHYLTRGGPEAEFSPGYPGMLSEWLRGRLGLPASP